MAASFSFGSLPASTAGATPSSAAPTAGASLASPALTTALSMAGLSPHVVTAPPTNSSSILSVLPQEELVAAAASSSSSSTAAAKTIDNDHISKYIHFKLGLAGSNYSMWKKLFHSVLSKYDAQGHVDVYTPPLEQDARWRHDDITILHWIYGTISDELYHVIATPENTAFQAWNLLNSFFGDHQAEFRSVVQGDMKISGLSLDDVDHPGHPSGDTHRPGLPEPEHMDELPDFEMEAAGGSGMTLSANLELRERIKPYFLRRIKSEVSLETGLTDNKRLPKKNELIIWLQLTDRQRQLYKAFLNSELVHLAASQGNPLAAITVLKKICDHPQILTKRAAEHILEGMDGMLKNQEMGMAEKMGMNLADMAHDNDDDDVVEVGPEVSCKLFFILALLRNLLEEGHHVLIFSQTRKMLNLIQEAILLEGYKFLRMDGVTEVSERERIVKNFQEGLGAQIFLLTTQAGGLGLTLTKAARVIVVDPAWNPSADNQSVDRAYRIGQTKDVIVYRLITSATIEEKIYKLQVLKGALFREATEKNEQTRYFSQSYFSQSEIQDLFSLPEQGFDVSLTQKQLQEEHGHPLDMDESLREHIEFLEQQGIAGVSHHSLLFSKTEVLPMLSENDALGRGADAKKTNASLLEQTQIQISLKKSTVWQKPS
nr:SNF2 domain-containing protein ENL1-like isoform X2 [Lolium perenne]